MTIETHFRISRQELAGLTDAAINGVDGLWDLADDPQFAADVAVKEKLEGLSLRYRTMAPQTMVTVVFADEAQAAVFENLCEVETIPVRKRVERVWWPSNS